MSSVNKVLLMLDRARNGDSAAAGSRAAAHDSWTAPAQARPAEHEFIEQLEAIPWRAAYLPRLAFRARQSWNAVC